MVPESLRLLRDRVAVFYATTLSQSVFLGRGRRTVEVSARDLAMDGSAAKPRPQKAAQGEANEVPLHHPGLPSEMCCVLESEVVAMTCTVPGFGG